MIYKRYECQRWHVYERHLFSNNNSVDSLITSIKHLCVRSEGKATYSSSTVPRTTVAILLRPLQSSNNVSPHGLSALFSIPTTATTLRSSLPTTRVRPEPDGLHSTAARVRQSCTSRREAQRLLPDLLLRDELPTLQLLWKVVLRVLRLSLPVHLTSAANKRREVFLIGFEGLVRALMCGLDSGSNVYVLEQLYNHECHEYVQAH